jgi:hypothetical protein
VLTASISSSVLTVINPALKRLGVPFAVALGKKLEVWNMTHQESDFDSG